MATTITMPQLGETVTEGTVERWLKRPGDAIDKYEPFVEVSTDKVNSEVPAPVTGTIRELLVQEGQTVSTGTPIAIIDERTAAPTGSTPAAIPAAAPAAGNGRQRTASRDVAGALPAEPAAGGAGALRGASPAVRKLAREHRVDVRTIAGTGANGRVTANDVLAVAHAANAQAAPSAAARPHARTDYTAPVPGTTIPLTSARRIIAERMVESKHAAPHAWTAVEIDVTNVWAWREREKARFEQETGAKLTLLPFFVRAVVEALAAFPLMNARFTPEGIQVLAEVNIGIAIGLPANLVVPVVKGADALSIGEIARAAADLIARARANALTADDLHGGTFTVNNNGANGSVLSAPIIHGGQAGIITMEAAIKRPVVVDDDAIAVRSMMNVCLSLDHRVVDGYVASGFLAEVKRRLEAMGPGGEL